MAWSFCCGLSGHMEISFDNLPNAVSKLQETVNNIERLLLLASSNEQQNEPERWLNIDELCAYLPDKPKKSTVYSWVHYDTIPNHKARGTKKLKFLKSEIDAWMKQGKRKTLAETAAEADLFLQKQRKGGGKW